MEGSLTNEFRSDSISDRIDDERRNFPRFVISQKNSDRQSIDHQPETFEGHDIPFLINFHILFTIPFNVLRNATHQSTEIPQDKPGSHSQPR
jgi:hypothetical protein